MTHQGLIVVVVLVLNMVTSVYVFKEMIWAPITGPGSFRPRISMVMALVVGVLSLITLLAVLDSGELAKFDLNDLNIVRTIGAAVLVALPSLQMYLMDKQPAENRPYKNKKE
jgi:hypothetical protein